MSTGSETEFFQALFASNSIKTPGPQTQPEAAGEYQSLFENAVCGIYRDRLDGSPVRANRALYTFNGYGSEEEHLDAVIQHGGSWYVDPDRQRLFQHLMETQGFVRDLVSEVYRHRTKERAWITENAWYVRDGDGNPIYIEGTIQDATDRVTALAEVERHANTDLLTGAASRFCFLKELHDHVARCAQAPVALLTVDLDKFKEVNDLFGHSAGDMVLRMTARRLRKAAEGREAIVARMGGDEFAVLLPDCADEAAASAVAAAIVESMARPIDIEGHEMTIGASVGVALCPAHTQAAKELLTFADLALYQRKHAGRNGYSMFNMEMQARHKQRLALEKELNEAIAAGALELYYQPIVASGSRRITGVEALMRWNHPSKGLIPPDEFIPLAEEAGLMVELGNWAIRRACLEGVRMPAPVRVAVNVSPSQLRSAGIVETVRQALAESGIAPGRVILEITETAILSSEALVGRVTEELRAMGVGLALDDFGTGYSSLSYLQRYAFSEIKIDRSFVAGAVSRSVNAAIIRGVISIARDLNIDVVAEGVETEEQAAFLTQEGCGFLQGYFFCRPTPFSEICTSLAVNALQEMALKLQRLIRSGVREDEAPPVHAEGPRAASAGETTA
ncbi:putative bifunctional diguanylate cyclase/phosphodiesterase [Aestuariivirga sp.]|uniref:putative bifunctional diguanylate cyclase/phosphodiesterase n=1 Tax=Aestuariivirga sp. TaxID=2650926 RepID=UPI00391CA619